MIDYAPARTITRLGAPLIAFFVVQNVARLACLALVGRLGDAALAGIGVASAIYGVVLALLFGVDAGVQAIVARATGAGRERLLGEMLADALAVSAPLGAVLAAVLWLAGPSALALILPDKTAGAAGGAYISSAAPSLLFLAITIPINACWIGTGRPGIAFLVTAILAPVQVLLTYVLVFGGVGQGGLGAAGAGLSASLSTLVAVALQLLLAVRLRPISGFPRSRPTLGGYRAIARLGWPISVQQSLLQFGLMAMFVLAARLGTHSTAAMNVLASLISLPVQITTGLAVAAAILVGQALGGGDIAEARAWGWRTAVAGALISAPLGLLAVIAPRPLLGAFLHDPATTAIALLPARLLGLALALDAMGRVLCFALRGAGATKFAAGIPFAMQWLMQLPLAWYLSLKLGLGLSGIIAAQATVAMLQAAATSWIWARGSWADARVGINGLDANVEHPAKPRSVEAATGRFVRALDP